MKLVSKIFPVVIGAFLFCALSAFGMEMNIEEEVYVFDPMSSRPSHLLELDSKYRQKELPEGLLITLPSLDYPEAQIITLKFIIPGNWKVSKQTNSVPGKWQTSKNILKFVTDTPQQQVKIQFIISRDLQDEKLVKLLKQNLKNVKVAEITSTGKAVKVALPNEALFPIGNGKLNRAGVKSIQSIFKDIRPEDIKEVLIEGHTDNVPIKSLTYPSNYELSAARAAAAVPVLLRLGFRAEQITTVGYADNKPIGSNTTSEGRGKNRRIEFTLKPIQKIEPDVSGKEELP